MKTKIPVIIAAGVCGVFFTAPSGFSQGTLAPSGAPAPTMKSLSQIEPRTPISSLPYTISIPGSYYFTTNLAGTSGITITTNDVTVDLNGFTLLGTGGAGSGIYVGSPVENLTIRNGVLDSWGGYGAYAANCNNSQFERLRISNCNAENGGNVGGLYVGSNCVVLVCTVIGNHGIGIDVGNNCIVKDCTASGNTEYGIDVGNDCTVQDCIATVNAVDGIYVAGNNCLISGNSCHGNGIYGIELSGSPNRVDGNSVGYNLSYGINADSLNMTNCIIRNFSPGPGYGGYAGNTDYAPIGKPSTATNAWQNF
jgi:parallel beta-helix repeat protein